MRLCLDGLNPTVGAIDLNRDRIAERIRSARAAGVDLVVFPELAICGYPPRDLLLEDGFVEACEQAVASLAEETSGIAAAIGLPARDPRAPDARRWNNAVAVYRDGRPVGRCDKRLLPTYDVFDEDRYFVPGDGATVIDIAGRRVGFAVCEDLWRGEDVGFASRYRTGPDPVGELAQAGAEIVVSPSASPFVLGKIDTHERILAAHGRRHGIWLASVNQLGANDDLIFDGRSLLVDPGGRTLRRTRPFHEARLTVDLQDELTASPEPAPEKIDELIDALALGIRDYLRKTGFSDALIGLSGGIDSAVTAALAAIALGPERVLGVSMPGRYSTDHSKSDAARLAEQLGVRYESIPIGQPFDGFGGAIDPALERIGEPALGSELPDVAEENLLSRCRGTILMTLSNRTGALLLTTGNKSELAVGYCTLYGDMNGGLAVLSDVPKGDVYAVARRLNEAPGRHGMAGSPIPQAILNKPPSAELAPDQRDQDSLPAYEVLDEIVARHVERRQSAEAIVRETGFDPTEVRRVVRMTALSEYKRKQAPLGLKVRGVAFGAGRRMPVAQRWFV
jgi:NAD+ synthetase